MTATLLTSSKKRVLFIASTLVLKLQGMKQVESQQTVTSVSSLPFKPCCWHHLIQACLVLGRLPEREHEFTFINRLFSKGKRDVSHTVSVGEMSSFLPTKCVCNLLNVFFSCSNDSVLLPDAWCLWVGWEMCGEFHISIQHIYQREWELDGGFGMGNDLESQRLAAKLVSFVSATLIIHISLVFYNLPHDYSVECHDKNLGTKGRNVTLWMDAWAKELILKRQTFQIKLLIS